MLGTRKKKKKSKLEKCLLQRASLINSSYLLVKHPCSRESILLRFGRLLTKVKSTLIELRPECENSINSLFKKCVVLLILLKKCPLLVRPIISTLAYLPKSNPMTCVDKLNSSEITH